MNLYLRIFLAFILPLAIGCLFILPTITSDNGYVAGFVFLPFFFLSAIVCIVLLILGLVMTGVKGRPGLWWLPAGPMVVIGFMGLAMFAKQFEIGAYREEPMISFPPPIANRVDFKQDATHEDIERFWTHVIGSSTENGHLSRPGVQSAARTGERTVTFAFRAEATEEQKADIRARINAYTPVERCLENVPSEFADPAEPDLDNSNGNRKKSVTFGGQNSNR